MTLTPAILEATLSLDPVGTGDAYRAQWAVPDRPPERGACDIVLPCEELRELEHQLAAGRAGREVGASAALARDLGIRLFEAVFQGHIHACYDEAYRQARQSAGGLRVRTAPPRQPGEPPL